MTSKSAIQKLASANEQFRALAPEMPAQAVAIFLMAVMNEGCTMKQLSEWTGTSQASVSRNVAMLGKWHRLHKPGLGLMTAEEDPYERRRKVVTLTHKGRQVAQTLSTILE